MLHSHTNQTKTSTFVHSKSLIPVNTPRVLRELVREMTTPLSFFTPRDLKISPLFQELETSLESTELPWESTNIKDSSTQACSSTVHGHCSQLTKNLLLKRLEKLKEVKVKTFLINSQENIIVLRNKKALYCQISENGLNNISLHKMSSPLTCMSLLTKHHQRKVISMFWPRSFTSTS